MADDRVTALRRVLDSNLQFVLLIIAVVTMVFAMGGFYYTRSTDNRDDTWVTLAHSLSQNIGDIARIGDDATHGVAPDFVNLAARADDFGATVQALAQGDADAGVKAAPESVQQEVAAAAAAWKQMKVSVDAVLAGEAAFRRVVANSQKISDEVHTSTNPGDDKGLFHTYEDIAEKLAQRGAAGTQIYLAGGQLARLERLSNLANRLLSNGLDAQVNAAVLDRETKTFIRYNESLQSDGSVAPQARSAGERFAAVAQATAAIQTDAGAVAKLQQSATQLRANAANVIAAASALEQKLLDTRVRQVILPILVYISGVLAILALVAFVVINYLTVRERARRAEERDAQQQQAILSLLDEITNLANGDLTGELTVTADFTGNIADSLNYTVQTLRGLVGTINGTSVEIATAATSTTQRVRQMSDAAEGQAREIVRATQAISTANRSLENVAGRAESLAEQAKGSVETAHNGAATVGRTIKSMATLREQIQDTAKRIKRLGESSQEIGNIIEFINDIAEQTNTLALNASIQAAMAGESGRGFAVVAEEVQRLAERAASATKQIENLVKTIQADTQEAITSMERSTANVVGGAKSAEEAGLALTRIEASSQELAKVIQDIAGAARTQSAETTRLASTMQSIREISVQTSSTAHQTAESVGELSLLSEKLRESVAGFKLPTDMLTS